MMLLNNISRTKKVLVAGGAGFLGSVLVKKLSLLGFKVVVCDNFGFGQRGALNGRNRLEIINADISKIPESILAEVAAVINLAALSNDAVCEMFPDIARKINLDNAIELGVKAKTAGVSQYIFSSSCAIYGTGFNLTEDCLPNPISFYAKLKLEAEKELLKLAGQNFFVTVLRNATLFGLSPRMRFDLVVNTMTLSAFQKRAIKVDGGGEQFRPLTHVTDAASAFLLAMGAEPNLVQKQIFNIVSENKKVLEIAEVVAQVVPKTKLEITGEPDGRSYHVDGRKARLLLRFAPKVLLKDAVGEIFTALKNGLSTAETKVADVYTGIFEPSLK
jgi:nucleoside-diphosphate-sugar epimerase